MLSHRQIWSAIDALAARHGLSPSGLARAAGLDATAFNPSKRTTPGGKPRWPTTESLSKILDATGESFADFALLASGTRHGAVARRIVPLIGFAKAGSEGFFDDSGFPAGAGWEQVPAPAVSDDHAYALQIAGDSMVPVYRDGDIVIVSPAAQVRRGDRVVVKSLSGEVLAKVLARQTARRVELRSLNPAHGDRALDLSEIAWMSRIVWASQ